MGRWKYQRQLELSLTLSCQRLSQTGRGKQLLSYFWQALPLLPMRWQWAINSGVSYGIIPALPATGVGKETVLFFFFLLFSFFFRVLSFLGVEERFVIIRKRVKPQQLASSEISLPCEIGRSHNLLSTPLAVFL